MSDLILPAGSDEPERPQRRRLSDLQRQKEQQRRIARGEDRLPERGDPKWRKVPIR